MITCALCNSRLAEADNFCPHCGASIHKGKASDPDAPPTNEQIDQAGPRLEPKSMRRRVGVVLAMMLASVLLIGAVARQLHPLSWVSVITTDGRFQISFPEQARDQSNKSSVQYASSDSHGDHYLAQFVNVGQIMNETDAYTYLDTYAATLAKQSSMDVIEKRHATHLNKPGLEETLFDSHVSRYLRVWLTVTDDTSIFLGIESADAHPQHYDQFIASLVTL